jgi:hypothetical protein
MQARHYSYLCFFLTNYHYYWPLCGVVVFSWEIIDWANNWQTVVKHGNHRQRGQRLKMILAK